MNQPGENEFRPPTVYGELSILGYNGYIPNAERNGRRNRSKFLLCKRPVPNGIKKSRHYIVKQPSATKAIQDKELHSISYTFSRTQTIIVEYRQDENTDMFQIGRSTEEPIDFVVMDTPSFHPDGSSCTGVGRHHHHGNNGNHHHHHQVSQADSTTSNQQQQQQQQQLLLQHQHHQLDLVGMNHRLNRHQHQHHHQHMIPKQVGPGGDNHHQEVARGGGGGVAVGQQQATAVAAAAAAAVASVGPYRPIPLAHIQSFAQRSAHQHSQAVAAAAAAAAAQAVLLNFPQPNLSNLPPLMAGHFLNQAQEPFQLPLQQPPASFQQQLLQIGTTSGSASGNQLHQPPMQSSNQLMPQVSNLSGTQAAQHHHQQQQSQQCSSRHNNPICSKRSHATQSTISRFACRILVDRDPPYTARIYAAGFDSSKNIFLGEKATKWEQNNLIDGLTTNGVLLLHPKQGLFQESKKQVSQNNDSSSISGSINNNSRQQEPEHHHHQQQQQQQQTGDKSNSTATNKRTLCSNTSGMNESTGDNHQPVDTSGITKDSELSMNVDETNVSDRNRSTYVEEAADATNDSNNNGDNSKNNGNDADDEDENKNDETKNESIKNITQSCSGGVWREVSVDGGIYAIRETRSAAQKGNRIENEDNILQDGTLIDLCGATLLWRSVDGFKAAPTKKSLEEKIDILNASRPQCPVGLNTLVIPRKPLPPANLHNHHHHHHHPHNHHHNGHKDNQSSSSKDSDKSGGGHQPYVYLKCGHVQGYHDWGATEKSDQRTCPICLSVGQVAKLSMGLEPSFYVDTGPLTHVFSPCGHMASERTVRYWCTVKIPFGTHFFHSICPFCATPLATTEPASTRLIFQDDLD